MNEYRIVLFGLNYSNTEYLKSNSSPPKNFYVNFVTKWDEENLILYFHPYMRTFYCVFYTYLAYKKFLNYSVFGDNYSGIRILFGNHKWTEYRIRIVLFGLNYSNTEYLTSNSTSKNFFICEFCEKWDEDTLILFFILTWGLFTVFSTHILLIKNSRTIRYSVTTIRVFKYYSEITNGPNTEYE